MHVIPSFANVRALTMATRHAMIVLVAVVLLGCGDDVRRGSDASMANDDGGLDGRVACPALACPSTQFCETSSCGSAGACIDRPSTCPLSFSPVCGCNRITYQNDCHRRSAGVGRANIGPCNDHCDLTPRRADCCFNDGDCRGTNQLCAGALCDPTKEGRCVTQPSTGMCWFDHECGDGGVCSGASLCGCGLTCAASDHPGTCETRDGG